MRPVTTDRLRSITPLISVVDGMLAPYLRDLVAPDASASGRSVSCC
jgi:hypothetical protein